MKLLTKIILVFFAFLFFNSEAFSEEYEFIGEHLIASYYGCDKAALTDFAGLKRAMEESVEKTGAHVLHSCSHKFDGEGFTMVILISESHASVHTYPEHDSCFIDIFTCGKKDLEKFDESLRTFLKPKKVNMKTFWRN